MSRDVYKELPNCKIGVTNTVHQRLRELKQKGDNFNDVIVRLLPEKVPERRFDVVEAMSQANADDYYKSASLCPHCCNNPCKCIPKGSVASSERYTVLDGYHNFLGL